MKKHLLILCLVILLAITVIFVTSSRDPFRSILKTELVNVLDRINRWGAVDKSFTVEQEYIAYNSILAASEKLVYKEGEPIILHFYRGEIIKGEFSFYSPSGKLLERRQEKFSVYPDSKQNLYNTNRGFQKSKFKFLIDPAIENGWVNVELFAQNQQSVNIPVLIESRQPNRTIFVESTDTLNAYISAPGLDTFYSRTNAPLGAFTKPRTSPVYYKIIDFFENSHVNCNAHLINADLVHKKMIHGLGHEFSTVSDNFLDNPDNLKLVKTIIFGAHNEYWTKSKANNIYNFLKNGGKVLFLGGNTAWRIVERRSDLDVIYGNNLLDDGYADFINEVLGSYYDANGYHTYAEFESTQLGTSNLKHLNKVQLPKTFGGGTDFQNCFQSIGGASGHEMDKLLPTSHDSFNLVATGRNGLLFEDGADVVYRDFENGGAVLNFGSVSLWHRTSDPTIKNLVDSFLRE